MVQTVDEAVGQREAARALRDRRQPPAERVGQRVEIGSRNDHPVVVAVVTE
jgi:hypothetical protein